MLPQIQPTASELFNLFAFLKTQPHAISISGKCTQISLYIVQTVVFVKKRPSSVIRSENDTTDEPLVHNQTENLKPQKPNSEAAAKTIFPKTTLQPET